jgi:hypothetical protein
MPMRVYAEQEPVDALRTAMQARSSAAKRR